MLLQGAAESNPRVGQREDWLDYARIVAAVMVTLYHFTFLSPMLGETGAIKSYGLLGEICGYGYLGVDLFFIISGYVIFNSASDKSADQFAVARVVRLFPAYVVCVTFSTVIRDIWLIPVGLYQYITNLFIINYPLHILAIENQYWTLYFEILFYAFIFFIIYLKQFNKIIYIIIAYVIYALVIEGVKPHHQFGSGYYILFAAGCMLAQIQREGLSWAKMFLLVTMSVLAAKSAVDHAHNLKPWLNLQPNSYIIVGLILSFFSLFLIFMRRNPALPGARAAGALTYPLYLIHNNVGVLIIASIGLKWLGLGVALAAVLSLSWLINRVIERRYAALWKRLADQSIGALVRRSTSLRMR